MPAQQQTAVLEVSGVHWASEKAVAESVLGRRPGVLSVEATPCPRPRPSPTRRSWSR